MARTGRSDKVETLVGARFMPSDMSKHTNNMHLSDMMCSENPGSVFLMSAKRCRHAAQESNAWLGLEFLEMWIRASRNLELIP